MNRAEFEHIIAAAANVSGEDEFIVIGSQAILGSFAEPPAKLLFSMEVDIFPLANPEKSDEIDGALGDGSPFHATFGFYAHGVGPTTAKPPAGWKERLVRLDIPARVGAQRSPVAFCLEPHDLILAKCVAGRERDWQFARDALDGGVVNAETLLSRVDQLPVSVERQQQIRAMLVGLIDASSSG